MDLTILISTIITATSALVAIIGGFLVSRVISLSSERGSINRKLKEIQNDLSARSSFYNRVNSEVIQADINEFFKDNIELIIEVGNDFDRVYDQDKYTELSKEELKPHFNEFIEIIREVLDLIDQHDGDLSNDFNDLLVNNKSISKSDKIHWYELIYETIYDSFDNSPFGSMNRINMINPKIKENKDLRNSLKDEIHILELQRDEQIKILKDYSSPKGLWGGIGVLVYACAVGIAYPSILLPYNPGVYNDFLTKWVLLGWFFSELVALFIYLIVNLRRLTKYD